MEILAFLWWIIGTVVNAMIASAKNRSIGGAIVVSVLLTPLTSYLYLLAVPKKEVTSSETNDEPEED